MMPAALLFSTAIFLSSALLFVVEPLSAKRVLPFLGGGPQVWSTCMLFYQLTLLAGYLYAHGLCRRFTPRRQAQMHLGLLLAAAASLFLAPASAPGATPAWPALWLLGHLALSIGLPFFALSANGPLLQEWYARRCPGVDPYWLFAASNLGSLLALAAYPVLIEPFLGLSSQRHVWRLGFLILVPAVALCGQAAARPGPSAEPTPDQAPSDWSARARWVFLAFVPSSLLLGVTTHLTTDVAPIPLLWVLPLALYLITFILAFTAPRQRLASIAGAALPVLVIALLALKNVHPFWPLLAAHLAAFFAAAMVCHAELARTRRGAVTDYYRWLVVGGALGGAFNALAAPLLFRSVLEYPLALLLACGVAASAAPRPGRRGTGQALASAAALTAGAAWLWHGSTHPGLDFGPAAGIIALFAVMGAAARLDRRPLLLAAVFSSVLLLKALLPADSERLLFADRSFFGVHRVTADARDRVRSLYNGNTLHGRQYQAPELRNTAVGSYYDLRGPMGRILENSRLAPQRRPVAVVGLGAGSLLALARPGESWVFYEIDPAVIRIARDPRLFTFLSDSQADWTIVPGDGRLSLGQAPDGRYGLIIMDAFGSDAVPVHLLTREALQLYLSKLAPDGLLVFHVTNAYLDLLRPITDAGRSLGLFAATASDPGGWVRGGIGWPVTRWVVLSRSRDRLAGLAAPAAGAAPRRGIWTDDYSDLLSVVRWR